jgi:hypothetical protein
MIWHVGRPSVGELRQSPWTKVPLLPTYDLTYWFFGKSAALQSPKPDACGSGIEAAEPASFQ